MGKGQLQKSTQVLAILWAKVNSKHLPKLWPFYRHEPTSQIRPRFGHFMGKGQPHKFAQALVILWAMSNSKNPPKLWPFLWASANFTNLPKLQFSFFWARTKPSERCTSLDQLQGGYQIKPCRDLLQNQIAQSTLRHL